MKETFQAAIALIVVLGLMFLCFWLLKKFNRGLSTTKGRNIQIIEKVGIAPDKMLLLISVAGKCMVVGVTNHGMEKICDVDKTVDELMAELPVESGGFLDSLTQIIKSKKEGVSPFIGERNGEQSDGNSKDDKIQ